MKTDLFGMRYLKKQEVKCALHNLLLISTCYVSIIGILICGSLLDSENYIPCLVLIGIFIAWLILFYKVNKDVIDRYIHYNCYEDYDNERKIK